MTLAPTVETVPVQWMRATLTVPDPLIDTLLPREPSADWHAHGAVRVHALGELGDEETGLRRSLVQVDCFAYRSSDGVTPERPDWSKAFQIAEQILVACGARAAAQHRTVSRSGYWDARIVGVTRLDGPIRMPDPQRMARVRTDLRIDWTRGITST